jgi:hypothetical protein
MSDEWKEVATKTNDRWNEAKVALAEKDKRIAELEAECFALAANQCNPGRICDEHGNGICPKDKRIAELENARDTWKWSAEQNSADLVKAHKRIAELEGFVEIGKYDCIARDALRLRLDKALAVLAEKDKRIAELEAELAELRNDIEQWGMERDLLD